MRPKQHTGTRPERRGAAPHPQHASTNRLAGRNGSGESPHARPAADLILERFRAYLDKHSLSPVTIRNYLADMRAFSRWHASRRSGRRAAEFVPGDFLAYREHLCNETDHSTATVNRRLQSLRLFGRFLEETGQVAKNPTLAIKLVQNGNQQPEAPRTLSPEEVLQLEEAIHAGRPSLVLRDLAIVQLMLQAGLRVHEVAALRLRDLSPAWRAMKVQVRGNQRSVERIVPLNPLAARAVREYTTVRPAIPRVDHLFVSQMGQPLSTRSIQRVIDTYARAAGLENVCAQSLRHTCAKAMLEDTHDAQLVARWLGHRSTRILSMYQSGRRAT